LLSSQAILMYRLVLLPTSCLIRSPLLSQRLPI